MRTCDHCGESMPVGTAVEIHYHTDCLQMQVRTLTIVLREQEKQIAELRRGLAALGSHPALV